MKKRIRKISALSFLLAITLVFTSSCAFLLPSLGEECAHEVVTAGDCKTPGACASCGKQVGELGNHNYIVNTVAPTCTDGGYTEYVCGVCGDSYRSSLTSAVSHSYGEWIFIKQPTISEEGEMYRECSVCGFCETELVSPHEHTILSGDGKAPTCTSEGWEAYEYCSECQYSTKVIIKPTGHEWGDYTSNGDGTHTAVCQNDSSHTLKESCSGGDASGNGLPVCAYCHTEYDFAARAGNSTYGYHALGTYATYGEGMQLLYKELTAVCEEFFINNDDVALDGSFYVIGEFDLDDYGLNIDAGCAVWKIFYISNPLYYWLDATIVTKGDALVLTIADDYAKASDRRTADAAIEAITAECALLIDDDMTELEKVVTITSYIVENMEYAYESDGVTPVDDMWAHCMAGFATHGLGVCEAYAKTFMYLCLLNGVECIMGSGYAGEPHAWNYVKLCGEWYGADITWTDNSGDEAVFDYLGLSNEAMFKDHTSHSSTVLGNDFVYAPPELSDKSIELTSLYKNGDYVGMYRSIDEAFAAMTDENGEYEIRIGYYGFFTSSPTHSLSAVITPNVKKLTITGKNEHVGEGYLDNNSVIDLSSSLTLGSDLVMTNLAIRSDSSDVKINLSGHTLTLDGETVYITPRLYGPEEGSTVIAATSDMVYAYGGMQMHRLTVNNEGVVFGADSTIKYCNSTKFYKQGEVEIDVEYMD